MTARHVSRLVQAHTAQDRQGGRTQTAEKQARPVSMGCMADGVVQRSNSKQQASSSSSSPSRRLDSRFIEAAWGEEEEEGDAMQQSRRARQPAVVGGHQITSGRLQAASSQKQARVRAEQRTKKEKETKETSPSQRPFWECSTSDAAQRVGISLFLHGVQSEGQNEYQINPPRPSPRSKTAGRWRGSGCTLGWRVQGFDVTQPSQRRRFAPEHAELLQRRRTRCVAALPAAAAAGLLVAGPLLPVTRARGTAAAARWLTRTRPFAHPSLAKKA